MGDSVIDPIRVPFRAIAIMVVPEADRLDARLWSECEALVEHTLAGQPSALRRQLRLFVGMIELLPVLRYGRRFSRLDDARRARFLHGFEVSRIGQLRKGFWGLRTLILLGYYGREDAAREIGYRPELHGWDAPR